VSEGCEQALISIWDCLPSPPVIHKAPFLASLQQKEEWLIHKLRAGALGGSQNLI